MTKTNAVYFLSDDPPKFNNALIFKRLLTSDPMGPSLLIQGDEHTTLEASCLQRSLDGLFRRSKITVLKGEDTPEDWSLGHTILLESDTIPERWESVYEHKVPVSNTPFAQRVQRGEVVMAPYSVAKITVTSNPQVIEKDWGQWSRTYFDAQPDDFVGWRGNRFFILESVYVENIGMLTLTGWRGNNTLEVIPTIPISARAVFDLIRQQSAVDNGTVTKCLGNANKGTVDALTSMAEAPPLIRSVIAGFRLIGKLARDATVKEITLSKAFDARKLNLQLKYSEDLYALERRRQGDRVGKGSGRSDVLHRRKVKRLKKTYKSALKRSGIEFVDAVSDVWMNFRYNIYPAAKTAEETLKILESLQVQFLRFAAFHYTTINLGSLGVDATVDIKGSCTIRRSVGAAVGLLGGNSGRVSANALVTAHELIKKSWVLDWFLNLGDFLAAFSVPTTYTQQQCSYAFKCNLNVSYTNPQGSRVEISGYTYDRQIINPFTHACLILQYDMNWMRYTDATALMWQAIRKDLITSSRR